MSFSVYRCKIHQILCIKTSKYWMERQIKQYRHPIVVCVTTANGIKRAEHIQFSIFNGPKIILWYSWNPLSHFNMYKSKRVNRFFISYHRNQSASVWIYSVVYQQIKKTKDLNKLKKQQKKCSSSGIIHHNSLNFK